VHSGIDRSIRVLDQVVVVLPSKFPCIVEDKVVGVVGEGKGSGSSSAMQVDAGTSSSNNSNNSNIKETEINPPSISTSTSNTTTTTHTPKHTPTHTPTPTSTSSFGLMKPRGVKKKIGLKPVTTGTTPSSVGLVVTEVKKAEDTVKDTVKVPVSVSVPKSNSDFRQFLK